MLADEERQPAAERVAGDRDVGGAAVQRRQPMGSRGLEDVLPEGAADDPGGAGVGVDGDAGQLGEPNDHDVVERDVGHGRGLVPGALRCDPEAGRRRGPDDLGDLVDGVGDRDGGRALVDRDVPGEAGGVVPGVAGKVDAATAEPAQLFGGGVGSGVGGHSMSFVGVVRVAWSVTRVPGTSKPANRDDLDLGVGVELAEAIGEYVDHVVEYPDVDGADLDPTYVADAVTHGRDRAFEAHEGEGQLGGGILFVHQSALVVVGPALRQEAEPGTGGHGEQTGPEDRHRTIPNLRGLLSRMTWWTGPPRYLGCGPVDRRRILGSCPRV